MTRMPRSGLLLLISGCVFVLLGLTLVIGGARLLMLGGSPYYLLAGLGMAVSGALLIAGRSEALWLYALLLFGTTVWALAEVRLDWWQLLPRLDVWFVLGLWLALPFVNRRLRVMQDGGDVKWRGGCWALGSALAIAAIFGIAALLRSPQDHPGAFAAARMEASGSVASPFVAAGDWTAYGRSGYGDRHAPAREITPQNVQQLQVAWTFHTGDLKGSDDPRETASEVTPLKANGMLYLCTPQHVVIALDPDTGKQRWRYRPESSRQSTHRRPAACRGVAYHDSGAYVGTAAAAWLPAPAASSAAPSAPRVVPKGAVAMSSIRFDECPRRILAPTADATIVAINADTGQPCGSFGDHGVIGLDGDQPMRKRGFLDPTSPPLATRHVLIVSAADTDGADTGVIRGYDIDTGKLLWNWDPSNPAETAPVAPGQTSVHHSPNSSGVSSVDEKLGLVYVPMGGQTPRARGGRRDSPGERFGSAIVALDIATGKLRWVYQSVHHDVWNLGPGGQPSLVDLDTPQGKLPALIAATRRGDIYVLDRRDGKPIVPAPEQPVPQGAATGDHLAPTQPFSALSFQPPTLRERDMWGATAFDQLICRIDFRKLRYDGIFTPPSAQGSLMHPGGSGVFDGGGISIDPLRQLAIVNPNDMAFVSRPMAGAGFATDPHPLLSPLGIPCQAPPWGHVAAVDLKTMQRVWMHRNGIVQGRLLFGMALPLGVPSLGGPLSTGGGVAFLGGTADDYLRAYDVRTGRQLWQSRLPASSHATPMSYVSDRSGRQYVVVMTGGRDRRGTTMGGSLVAYALPGSPAASASTGSR
ncbi:PQQ-binding-like beta-propeller repeat protein [Rhodanobacter sp. T12-5]|uniref:outer membrane protein assembly factor BamB family protein n=1 Tax=Rhodanobacter sp. T12-5 TaxID=2024611 RepID=UPI0011EF2F5D|nr:PQQ-binding-like beta-propeller repeat protein [Rhodanobacter sp. T12-5]KAA0072224.1 membrane-bound PQQ-dependent dehydrogenase, glucose/quinate/shikimate family [Rhodanobacter sp. T12-5]